MMHGVSSKHGLITFSYVKNLLMKNSFLICLHLLLNIPYFGAATTCQAFFTSRRKTQIPDLTEDCVLRVGVEGNSQ